MLLIAAAPTWSQENSFYYQAFLENVITLNLDCM